MSQNGDGAAGGVSSWVTGYLPEVGALAALLEDPDVMDMCRMADDIGFLLSTAVVHIHPPVVQYGLHEVHRCGYCVRLRGLRAKYEGVG